MTETRRAKRVVNFLLMMIALVVGVYSISNLMPLLLKALVRGLNLSEAFRTLVYLIAVVSTILVLARGIYKLDKRAGRIRNRIGWFE